MTLSATSDKLVLMGAILGAHGIKGEVKVKSFAAKPSDIAGYGALTDAKEKCRFELSIVGTSDATRGILIARIAGVADRNAAEALKGTELYVARESLPKLTDTEEFYFADLVGLQAVDEGGKVFGRIVSVDNYGAGDLLLVAPENGGDEDSFVVPFTKAFVPVVDIAAGKLVLNLPKDFFEVPEQEPETEEELREASR
ncbi:MAG TPA: ribosome maturation factor RimM [Dongiaceae bacterium]|nr:ribosome maturation factor RimM [Dongiaceae bacterium]